MTHISNRNSDAYFTQQVHWLDYFCLSLFVYVSTKRTTLFNNGPHCQRLWFNRFFNKNRFRIMPLEIYPHPPLPLSRQQSDSSLRNPWFKSAWRQPSLITEDLLMTCNLYIQYLGRGSIGRGFISRRIQWSRYCDVTVQFKN
jgi:hypothetical protein